MNTTGIQNYLSNVFRPIYTYDTTASNFTPKLELSNIDNFSGNTISVFSAAVGDSASNVYVGSNAGNSFDVVRACSDVTALGYGAASNISNDSNSVYIGWYAGASGSNSSNVISIGKSSGGNGVNNIFLGTSTGTAGQSNILIGHFIAPSNVSNQIRIGYSNQIPIAADLSRNWVGLGGPLAPSAVGTAFDVSGSSKFVGNLGLNIDPGTRTLDVNGNFRARDASLNALDFSNGITFSTQGYASSNGTTATLSDTQTQTIGTLKKGMILISAQNNVTAGSNYDSRVVYASDAAGATAPAVLSSQQSGSARIIFTTSNIIVSNSGGASTNYGWSITYLPVP